MAEAVDFVVKGKPVQLSQDDVLQTMAGVQPHPIRGHAVRVGGVWYPVNQVFVKATGLPTHDFTGEEARRHLEQLGFDLKRRHAVKRAKRL